MVNKVLDLIFKCILWAIAGVCYLFIYSGKGAEYVKNVIMRFRKHIDKVENNEQAKSIKGA